jgi:DNA-binding MarR family transcriptional regulator
MKQEIILKQKIGMRLARIGTLSKVYAAQTFTKKGIELTPEQLSVLLTIKDNDGIYQRQLATLTLKDRPNITRLVTILEEGGYITSQVVTDGRQVKKLFITPKGIELCKTTLPTVISTWEESVKGLSEKETETLLKIIDKIESNLKEKILDRLW